MSVQNIRASNGGGTAVRGNSIWQLLATGVYWLILLYCGHAFGQDRPQNGRPGASESEERIRHLLNSDDYSSAILELEGLGPAANPVYITVLRDEKARAGETEGTG